MDLKKIAIAAIKEEALAKGEEKIFVCGRLISYKDLAIIVEKGQDQEVKRCVLDPYVIKLKTETQFRIQVFAMLGLSNNK